jgi:hypothetical protein
MRGRPQASIRFTHVVPFCREQARRTQGQQYRRDEDWGQKNGHQNQLFLPQDMRRIPHHGFFLRILTIHSAAEREMGIDLDQTIQGMWVEWRDSVCPWMG